jgi:hypothetical protein
VLAQPRKITREGMGLKQEYNCCRFLMPRFRFLYCLPLSFILISVTQSTPSVGKLERRGRFDKHVLLKSHSGGGVLDKIGEKLYRT